MATSVSETPYLVLTTEERAGVLARLEQVHQALYKNHHAGWEALCEEKLTDVECGYIKKQMTKGDQVEILKVLADFKQRLEAMPILEVALAFQPRAAFRKRLMQWVASHGPVPCQVNLKVDPGIIGGL